jgi:hypothetical protein
MAFRYGERNEACKIITFIRRVNFLFVGIALAP